MRKLLALLPAAALVALAACADAPVSPELASFQHRPGHGEGGGGSPHFMNADCWQDGDNVVCQGRIAGVGSQNRTVRVTATGTADVLCTNPGGQRVEAQDQPITAAGSGAVVESTNGTFVFYVTATPAATNACPNGRWTFQLANVEYDVATVELRRGNTVYDTYTDGQL